jgi:N-hydroxyarylamine O-acetyltransferase
VYHPRVRNCCDLQGHGGEQPAPPITYGTGGTCWAGNGALHVVLVALGFEATSGMGTMRTAPDAPPAPGTVLVTCEETCYVVDVSIVYTTPLPLHDSAPTSVAHPAWGVHCSKRNGRWCIHDLETATV